MRSGYSCCENAFKKASDLDNMLCSIIKNVARIISGPLSKIFNKSLSSGVFPDELKDAKITPIFKSGLRCEVNNYRPISVLSVILDWARLGSVMSIK